MADVAEIVRGLSKAQREVVRNAWPYPDYHRTGEQISYCPVQINHANGEALGHKGLAAMKATGGPRLTPLGQQVRAALLSKESE